MVWQQWVLLIWMIIRLPFGVAREIREDRSNVPPEKLERVVTIGICTYLFIAFTIIALVVTI